jgi:hypothetical protein
LIPVAFGQRIKAAGVHQCSVQLIPVALGQGIKAAVSINAVSS